MAILHELLDYGQLLFFVSTPGLRPRLPSMFQRVQKVQIGTLVRSATALEKREERAQAQALFPAWASVKVILGSLWLFTLCALRFNRDFLRGHRGGTGHGNFQHAVAIARLYVVRADSFGQRNGALKGAVADFALEVIVALLLLACFALTLDGEVIADDRHLKIFRVNTGEVGFDDALISLQSAP
jgi:hypothetical protein